jgi:hypothetical protein
MLLLRAKKTKLEMYTDRENTKKIAEEGEKKLLTRSYDILKIT